MRGRDEGAKRAEICGGITPAYAGKSQYLLYLSQSLGDHPRVCGEEKKIYTPSEISLGSPPRMRGRAHPLSLGIPDKRITPAYAGKSYEKVMEDGDD